MVLSWVPARSRTSQCLCGCRGICLDSLWQLQAVASLLMWCGELGCVSRSSFLPQKHNNAPVRLLMHASRLYDQCCGVWPVEAPGATAAAAKVSLQLSCFLALLGC